MIFATPDEVFLAHGQGKVGVHARIKLRLPADKRLRGDGEEEFTPGTIIRTTVGRVFFNDILHARMPFYNLTMGQEPVQRIIADCYQILGRRETIELLDDMKDLGFRDRTRCGLSFATDDLMTPAFQEQDHRRSGRVLKITSSTARHHHRASDTTGARRLEHAAKRSPRK